jgi:hypothetical protein
VCVVCPRYAPAYSRFRQDNKTTHDTAQIIVAASPLACPLTCPLDTQRRLIRLQCHQLAESRTLFLEAKASSLRSYQIRVWQIERTASLFQKPCRAQFVSSHNSRIIQFPSEQLLAPKPFNPAKSARTGSCFSFFATYLENGDEFYESRKYTKSTKRIDTSLL